MAAFTSELMEEEQDEEVLGDIASLFDQAQGLILSGRFNVTLNVSLLLAICNKEGRFMPCL